MKRRHVGIQHPRIAVHLVHADMVWNLTGLAVKQTSMESGKCDGELPNKDAPPLE